MRLDQLSDALHDHADSVRDIGAPDRLQAVRGRVRTVRRRRAAATSAAAVAVVAAVGIAVLPTIGDRDTGPADAPGTLAGHDVPPTLEATGFTYEYAEGVVGEPGENPLKHEIPVGDRPRLVAFASSEIGSTLVARTDPGTSMGAPSGDFTTYLLLEPGGEETVTLRQLDGLGDGELALAVYDLAEEPPAGITDGTHTFREEVAGWTLVGGAIGEPGQTDVRFEVTLPEGRLRWDAFCHSGGEDLMAKQSVEGTEGWSGSGCGDTPSYGPDASQDITRTIGEDPAPRNRPIEARVWLGPTDGGPRDVATDDDVVLGLAVYSATGVDDVVPAPGGELDRLYEAHGHTWSVEEFLDVPGRNSRFSLTLPAHAQARTVRLVVSTDPDGPTEVRARVGGHSDGDTLTHVGNSETTLGPFVVLPGRERDVIVDYLQGMPAGAEVTALVGTLAD